jgi:PTH1 family peptidyl-tRNA hydrolase
MQSGYAIVVGLGNPGSKYDGTRHNIGFAVVDALRACSGIRERSELEGEALRYAAAAIAGSLGHTGWSDRKAVFEASLTIAGAWSGLLIKPQTFMNRSGEPLREVLSFRKVAVDQVIVVHDDIDLPFGGLRIKVGGGDGGHNGLRSISTQCGGREFARIRVGVGRPAEGSALATDEDGIARWVLARFSAEERGVAEALVARSAASVACLAIDGLKTAQNRYNR